MRIISQNKDCDVQYESVAVAVNSNENEHKIIAFSPCDLEADAYITLGNCGTEDAAQSVLKRIREHYDSICLSKFSGCENEYYVPEIFEMPQAQEVEK